MRRSVVLGAALCLLVCTPAGFFVAGSSGAATAGPALDHFECYSAATTSNASVRKAFPGTPAKVVLKNTFAPAGFDAAPGAAELDCNPVQTVVASGGHSVTTPVTNANGHLFCRAISAKGVALPPALTMKNRFGTSGLKPAALHSLCLPTWKNKTTPKTFPKATAPPNLGAYVCYTVSHATGTPTFARPASLKLQDQFGTVTVRLGAPGIVCAPTAETVSPAGASTKVVNAATYAVCFGIVAGASAARVVYDKNQFGIGAVKEGRNAQLCVPSQRVGVTPTSTTTTTTTPLPPGVVTHFAAAGIKDPVDIATGPDGAMWFTNFDDDKIGRITTDGAVTTYTGTGVSQPDGIAVGADGAMWFANTGNHTIGRITTDGSATITNYSDPKITRPYRLTAGPDGAMWFTTEGNTVDRLAGDGSVTTFPDAGISNPQGITVGPDGALWFCNYFGGTISRLTTSGTFTTYGDYRISYADSITVGTDGALWFTNAGTNAIGRMTTDGKVTNSFTNATVSNPLDITTGADGALWFTNQANNSIGRITTAGVISNYHDASMSHPDGLTLGPDGAIWFTNAGNDTIGRIKP